MIVKPNSSMRLDLFADADFAGLFCCESKDGATSVKSRTGWVTTLDEVPETWSSKHQSEIALSTMEPEYITLSTGMRELVGLRKLVKELEENKIIEKCGVSTVSKVWEENDAALKHAVMLLPKLTPRTKHIGVKYHWFKSKLKPGRLECHLVKTKLQKADIFTKGLVKGEFKRKRKLLMGW